jgi:GMP synthase-like glutamine amidotransferase
MSIEVPIPVSTSTVLVIQHGAHASSDLLLEVLSGRGLDPETVRPDLGEQLPDPDGLRWAVVLGGDAGQDDLDRDWTAAEVDWITRADAAGTAVFAVGSGAHSLARALGGDSVAAARTQRGWITVSSSDPELLSPGPWFAWGERALQLPPGAELLAHNSVGPQAFRIGPHLGVQFHPEATPELIARWVPGSPETLDSQGFQEATNRDYPVALPAARRLFTAFLDAAIA